MPRSRSCTRPATIITGCCAQSSTGAAAASTTATANDPRSEDEARAMLTYLKLRDLVIVDAAELEFGPGLTALTGETGAGKSIVVDALMLIAGGRRAGDIVRHGAERAEVAASFSRLSAGADIHERYRACGAEHETLAAAAQNRDARLDLLRYQLGELEDEVTTAAAI